MQNLKILHFILSHTAPVTRGRCNQIQRDYFGSSPLLHAVISHYPCQQSRLINLHHICHMEPETWTHARTPSCYVASISLWSFPPFPPISFASCPHAPSLFSFSLSLYVGVCGCVGVCPWDVQSAREIWQTVNSLKHFPCLSSHLGALTYTRLIWKMVQQYHASTQFVMRWNNLINCRNCWIWMGILSFPTFQRAHSSVVCDVMAWPWSFLPFPYFQQWTSFPRRTINDSCDLNQSGWLNARRVGAISSLS